MAGTVRHRSKMFLTLFPGCTKFPWESYAENGSDGPVKIATDQRFEYWTDYSSFEAKFHSKSEN